MLGRMDPIKDVGKPIPLEVKHCGERPIKKLTTRISVGGRVHHGKLADRKAIVIVESPRHSARLHGIKRKEYGEITPSVWGDLDDDNAWNGWDDEPYEEDKPEDHRK